MISATRLRAFLSRYEALTQHAHGDCLLEVATGDTGTSSSGFPYISQASFEQFLASAPHLFQEGQAVLDWARSLEECLECLDELTTEESDSLSRALRVLRTMVFTAGVTAPPDLWLLRQVISVHGEAGTLSWLNAGKRIQPESYAAEHQIDERQLTIDLQLLHSRGYLELSEDGFRRAPGPVGNALEALPILPAEFQVDLVDIWTRWFQSEGRSAEQQVFLRRWLQFETPAEPTGNWMANARQIEIGYRLVPPVLALRACELLGGWQRGSEPEHPALFPELLQLLEQAGALRNGRVTGLGARTLERGPGPFGIIASYHPYLNQLPRLLRAGESRIWVRRAANVAASQDANRKTFEAANDALDRFCARHAFSYSVFIEHAVGRGEATRQRFERSGNSELTFVGADLEDAAIQAARAEQSRGRLPDDMRFLGSADIGEPQRVLEFLKEQGLESQGAVMMVGNGLHEVREQTNEKMIAVLRQYQEAGILVIFTEESALSDEQLLETAWNTYHAGFRYVHELSGQGLRPAWEGERPDERYSWSKCARLAGYVRLDEFSRRTRSIFPYSKKRRGNPSISVTHFCVPAAVAERLGIPTLRAV